MEEIAPNIWGDVEEVSCHEYKCVLASLEWNSLGVKADVNAYYWDQIDEAVAQNGLTLIEAAFQQNCNISHLPGNLVSNYTDCYRQKLVGVSEAVCHTNGEAVDEVMQEWADKIEESSRFLALRELFSFVVFKLPFLFHIVVFLLLIAVPVRMWYAALFHESFQKDEGDDGSDESQCDFIVLQFFGRVCLRENVHCFTEEGSTGEGK